MRQGIPDAVDALQQFTPILLKCQRETLTMCCFTRESVNYPNHCIIASRERIRILSQPSDRTC